MSVSSMEKTTEQMITQSEFDDLLEKHQITTVLAQDIRVSIEQTRDLCAEVGLPDANLSQCSTREEKNTRESDSQGNENGNENEGESDNESDDSAIQALHDTKEDYCHLYSHGLRTRYNARGGARTPSPAWPASSPTPTPSIDSNSDSDSDGENNGENIRVSRIGVNPHLLARLTNPIIVSAYFLDDDANDDEQAAFRKFTERCTERVEGQNV